MHTIQSGITMRGLEQQRQGYEFQPKKWGWFARLLWRLLKKLGALHPHYGEIATYTFAEFHEEKLANYIIEAQGQDYHLYDRPKDYCLIMGRKDFAELIDSQKEMMRFSDLGTHRAYPIGYCGSYMGLPVHVVNTMEGYAVVPKIFIEESK